MKFTYLSGMRMAIITIDKYTNKNTIIDLNLLSPNFIKFTPNGRDKRRRRNLANTTEPFQI